ncbi:MAG: tagatose 1,6-diphosphate aldolase [Anaerococcus sp.]
MKVSREKYENLKKLANEDGVIAALAIDQRGSMRKMVAKYNEDLNNVEDISRFKSLVSRHLTKYSSAILLDPIYGMTAKDVRDENAGLLMSYEVTGYDNEVPGRLPILISDLSGLRIKEMGANAVKILLYYDVDEGDEINDQKKAFVERVGYECQALGLPFFLEIVTYDTSVSDAKSKEYAGLKPRKVIEAVKVFDDKRYMIDVLKLEVPVNMNFVEGFGDDPLHTKQEAQEYYQELDKATDIPYIFLSAGVSAELFQETIRFAKEAGSSFNGVLCGRATWANGVEKFAQGDDKAIEWLESQGKENITSLNKVLKESAQSIFDKIEC